MSSVCLAICIATHNAEKTIQGCLRSIPYSAKDSVVILIQDNLSQDETLPIAQKELTSLGLAHVICSESDEGIYDAWNRMAKKAHSEWITFIGSDDRFLQKIDLEAIENEYGSCNFITFQGLYGGVRPYGNSLAGYYRSLAAYQSGWKIMHQGSWYKTSLLISNPFNPRYKIAGDFEHLIRVRGMLSYAHVDTVVLWVGGSGVSARRPWLVAVEAFKAVASQSVKPKVSSYLIGLILMLKIIAYSIFKW
ncbi:MULTISPECIES: glycosyltransferase [Aphanothece]|uniref:glycosyltransferase n=1 Tax=Aphanothece TaxID=1121 RepID=UPI003984B410